MESTDVLEIHYADEEGDPYAVELAGRVGGFIVGKDSDFVIYNSEGYLGYVPLEDVVWTASVDDEVQNAEDDGDFQTVRKPKGKKMSHDPKLGKGLIPPDTATRLNLSFIVYKPSELAAHLKLPVTLLPLLGALVGNDFSNQPSLSQRSAQSLFFRRQLTLAQRIDHVAATLESILTASSQKRKPKYLVGSVMDLIDKAVDALLVPSRSTIGSGEIDNIISTVVDATLQYAIPKYEEEIEGRPRLWPTQVCALHDPDDCPLLPLFSRSIPPENLEDEREALAMREQVRSMYVRAYRNGLLPPKAMHILSTGTSWPRIFLENPDLETVARSIGRPIRQWAFAILEDGVGLPRRPGKNESTENEQDHPIDEEEELIDVIEEDSETESTEGGVDGDPLAFLRGELERLRKPGDEGDGVPENPKSLTPSQTSQVPPPNIIVEYVRRGTRVVGEEVSVPLLADLLTSTSTPGFDSQNHISLQTRSESDRLTVFLHALGSNTPAIRSLPAEQLMVAVALRWVIHAVSDRAQNSGGSKDREKERWTKTEAQALLASFPRIAISDHATIDIPSTEDLPPIVDRNIQLMAQILMALESISDLSQILLLSDRVPGQGHLLSGRRFHAYLTGVSTPPSYGIADGLWEACTEGLEDAFGEEWRKGAKKGAKRPTAHANTISPPKGYSKSLFKLLGDMEL
jgi:hypothetical protein